MKCENESIIPRKENLISIKVSLGVVFVHAQVSGKAYGALHH